MKHDEGFFQGARGARIYRQCWLPDDESKASVLIVHGLGEHCGRYANLVDALVPAGYALYGIDHVGHGQSEGTREYVERFDDYAETVSAAQAWVEKEQPGKPLFLYGHSMGGLIGAFYLLDHQAGLAGAVLSAPAVKVPDSISGTTIALGKVLSRLAPKAGVLGLDPTGVSRDTAVVQAYVDDPLVFHGKTPARLAAEMLRAMQRVTAEASKIALPLLLLQGSADRMVDPGGAPLLYNTVSSADKTLKVYDGFFHEVHNEPECSAVLGDVGAWLDAHAG